MVIIFVVDLWMSDGSGSHEFYRFLSAYLNQDSVSEIRNTVENTSISGSNLLESVIGLIILIVSATSLLGVIHETFNKIWGVKTSTKSGILDLLWSRLISLGMLVILAFIVSASLMLDALISNLGTRVHLAVLQNKVILFIFNEIVAVVFLTILFAAIFKILPDARIRWKNVWTGAGLTAILFTIGKFGIGFYLGISSISNTYGAAGSLVMVLLWVYYLTIILLIGAEFTKVLTLYRGHRVFPKPYAVATKPFSKSA